MVEEQFNSLSPEKSKEMRGTSFLIYAAIDY
jgi:hypothetical protein